MGSLARRLAILLLLALTAAELVLAAGATPPAKSGGGSQSSGASSGSSSGSSSSSDTGMVSPDEDQWLARQAVSAADGRWTVYEGGVIKQTQSAP